jgi:drug/metabolite transporter (DMT)-like permease
MWFFYAIVAAVIWGINYAVGGRLLQRGISAAGLLFLDVIFALIALGAYFTFTGQWTLFTGQVRQLQGNYGWLFIAMAAGTVANFLSLLAIQHKNATLASLIEISYPFFVALFAWLLFRDVQLSWATALGGFLILAGIAIIYRFN